MLIWSSGLFGNPVKALTVWAEPNQMQLAGSGTHNYHTITGKWIFEMYLITTQHQDISQSNFRPKARISESANLKEMLLQSSTVKNMHQEHNSLILCDLKCMQATLSIADKKGSWGNRYFATLCNKRGVKLFSSNPFSHGYYDVYTRLEMQLAG